MTFPRVGQSAPPTPPGWERERMPAPLVPSFTGESDCSTSSAMSSASRSSKVEEAVARFNSMSSPAPAPAPAPKSLSKATSMTFNGPPGASPTVRRRVPKPLPSLPDDGWGAARDLRTARAGGALPSPATATAAVFAIPPLPAVPPSLMVFDDPETSSPRTPVRPSHRFTRSLGSLVGLDEMPSPARMPKPVLPLNPAVWTPSELAQHLAYTLRTGDTGSSTGTPTTLPAPVIEDVVSWVLRSRVTGAQFMAGLDAQRGGRPPPFLPVLVSLGRKLRRATAMIPNGPPASSRTGHGHTRAPSDVFTDDGEDDDVTRVRRLAHAFDAISSCSESEAEGDTLSFLREQITGDSISGYGRATPRKEREEVKWVPRRESVISVTSDVSAVSSLSAAASAEAESGAESEAESALSGISGGSQPLWRMGEADASGSAAAAASDAVALWAQTCTIPIAEESEPEESEVPVNAKEKEKEKDKEASDSAGERGSPPPPYQHGVETQARTPATLLFPPETDSLSSSTRSAPRSVPRSAPRSVSLTPLPRKSDNNDTNENDDHLIRMAAHSASGVDPYRVLRRGSGRPTVIAAMVDEDSPLWPRVSRRKASASASKGTPQREVSREVAELTKRIRELEARLVAVEKSPEGSPDGSPEGSPEPEAKAEAEAEAEAEEKEEEHVCPNCSHGFALSASTSTRLSASTSSGLTASTSSQPPTASGSLGASTISISTRSLSPADTATTDATDVTDATDASDATAVAAPLTPETGALVPASQYAAQNLSWLTRLGLVDEYGADHRYRDVPVYLFLMGVGVGVGFSAVVVKVMLAKRIV